MSIRRNWLLNFFCLICHLPANHWVNILNISTAEPLQIVRRCWRQHIVAQFPSSAADWRSNCLVHFGWVCTRRRARNSRCHSWTEEEVEKYRTNDSINAHNRHHLNDLRQQFFNSRSAITQSTRLKHKNYRTQNFHVWHKNVFPSLFCWQEILTKFSSKSNLVCDNRAVSALRIDVWW